jgi:hypothetical protein
MKRTTFLLLLTVGASFAQQTKPITATSTFYDVTDGNERAYVDFSKNSTKKLVEASMKDDPAMRSVIFSVRLFGGNPEPAGRYRLVIIRDGFPVSGTERLAAISMKATGMSYEDYMKKAASLRKRTGQSLRQRIASTSGDTPSGIVEGDILRTDLMKIMPDRGSDYYNMERNDWQPLHAERVKAGAMKSWSLWAFRSPSGASREYDAVTTAVFKDLDSAMANPGYNAIYQKLHPGGNMTGISDRARTVRTIQRVDYWRVIWAVNRQ